MPKKIVLIPEAIADARDAYAWYEDQRQDWEINFWNASIRHFWEVSKNPTLYPCRFDNFRHVLIRRFPYAVYFDFEAESVRVYSIFHCSQNPRKLKTRLGAK